LARPAIKYSRITATKVAGIKSQAQRSMNFMSGSYMQ
jgi:hypothetical protein